EIRHRGRRARAAHAHRVQHPPSADAKPEPCLFVHADLRARLERERLRLGERRRSPYPPPQGENRNKPQRAALHKGRLGPGLQDGGQKVMDDEVIPVETEKPPKERVKLTHSTWAKVGAIVLLYVSLIFVIACVICFILSAMGGASDYQGVLDSIDRGLKGWEIVYGLAKFASGLYAV